MAAISAIADVMNFAGPKWMSYCRLPLLTIHYCELTSKFCLNFVCFISSATSLDYFCITLVQMVLKMKTVGDKVVVHSLAYLSVWKWLVGDVPFYEKIWRILTHSFAKRASSVNTNRKSTMRFPMCLWWTSHAVPKPLKLGWKSQNGRFPCKIALHLKKVCYKVSLCVNCQRQSSKAFAFRSLV